MNSEKGKQLLRNEGAAFSIERGLVQNEHRADSSYYGYDTHEPQ